MFLIDKMTSINSKQNTLYIKKLFKKTHLLYSYNIKKSFAPQNYICN